MKLITLNDVPLNYKIYIYGNGYGGKIYQKVISCLRKDIKIEFIDDISKDNISLEEIEKEEEFYILNSIISPNIREKINNKIKNYGLCEKLITLKGIDEFVFREDKIPFFHVMSMEYFKKHEKTINWIIQNLSKRSAKLYQNLIKYRLLSAKRKDLLKDGIFFEVFSNNNEKRQYLEFIPPQEIKTILDGGVYDGKMSIKLLNYYKAEKLYGFEPFKNKFLKYNDKRMEIIEKGLWDKDTILYFKENASASKVASNGIKIETTTIDTFCKYKKIDLIKMDIEGSEFNAIKGGMKTIKRDRPFLAISIYHSIDDFVLLTKYIMENLKNYEFEIGVYSEYLHEIILYALPIEKIKGK